MATPANLGQSGRDTGIAREGAFMVHDPERVWVVESGTLDLFLVEVDDGRPAGSRHHVLRVSCGEGVFGLEPPPGSRMRLLAVPAPDSSVVELEQARLREPRFVQLLERWIAALCRAASPAVRPKILEYLDAGTDLQLTQSRVLAPRDGVAWVCRSEGRARFLGGASLLVPDGDAVFPLSGPAWIEGEGDCVLSVLSTEESLVRDPLRSGLRAFHRMALERIVEDREQALKTETLRLERRDKSEAVQLECALRELASPLRGVEAAPGDADDPWLLACAALEPKLGIRFKPQADRRSTAAIKDPAGAIARASGVRVRRVALKGEWWKRDSGPLLARRESGKEPVALVPASPRRYELYDPATRRRAAVDEEAASSLEPFGWCFYRPFPRKKIGVLDIVRFGLAGCKDDLYRIAGAGMAAGLMTVVLPLMTAIVIDSVIPGSERAQLVQIALFMVVAAASTFLFHLAQNMAMLRLEGKMDASIQAAIWDRLLSLPPPFFRDYTAGDLAARSLSIGRMRQILTGPVLSSMISGVFSVFSFAVLFYFSWRLALLATGLTLAAFLAITGCGILEVRYERDIARIKGRLSGALLQFINGISKLRVSGTENRAFASWAADFAAQKRIAVRSRRVSGALAVVTSVFPLLCGAVFFRAVSTGGGAHRLSTGEFLAFFAAFTQFQLAALAFGTAAVAALAVVPLYERAKPILHALPEVDPAKSHPGELSGDIEVKHVTFRYRPEAPLVLRDVSLKIPAGRFVAIVGPSGSGKSTLFRVLLGFETPESGSVYFDNQDRAHLDVQAVRQQIGVVLQSGRILGDTIFSNIVGAAPLTMDDAWEAARMAGFDADVKAMPMGMHTVVAEGGGGLSGGQRQRLMIARAVVKRPRILLFDEATSALDNETQAIVSRSLEQLQATRIVIAHRLSTIVNADYIYVMEKGSVVQDGTYPELIDKPGPFAELARRQIA